MDGCSAGRRGEVNICASLVSVYRIMILTGLAPLHASMKSVGVSRFRFPYINGAGVFDVIFLSDGIPYRLLFGAIAANAFFTIEVSENYAISTYLGEDYYSLIKALDLRFREGEKFSPASFFEHFNTKIPSRASRGGTPTKEELAPFTRDVEEADKIFFCGWRLNSGAHVTQKNLNKTALLCGQKAHDMCKTGNISSRWTDDATCALAFSFPPVSRPLNGGSIKPVRPSALK